MSNAFNPIGIELVKQALRNEIIPVPITIDWKKNKKGTISFRKYLKDFESQLKIGKYEKTYVFGFSFGAMIAFLTALKIKPDVLILGSLSPWFEEDRASIKKSDLKWWKKNSSDRLPLFNEIASKIKSKTYILVGQREFPELIRRAREAHRLIKHSSLKIIPGVGHDISKRKYMQAVKSVINKL